ncbi:MAG: trigger factor [Myxococcota bacterium]|nr:trigger factor [Myxococcota bacterium]MDW8363153.1 trigger factor [Myxococcales bacterium]
MSSTVQALSPVLVEIRLSVPWERLQSAVQERLREVGRKAHVRGFRPGKVPPSVLRQVYGRAVEIEAASELAVQGVGEALREHAIVPCALPEIDEPRIEAGRPVEVRARVEVFPRIERISYDGLEVSWSPPSVTDRDVETVVHRLRVSKAALQVPDPPRPSRPGDVLTGDLTVPGPDGSEHTVVGATFSLPDEEPLGPVDRALCGRSVGEQVDLAAAATAEQGASPPSTTPGQGSKRFVVREIRERILPALDDEFARDVGPCETLEQLRAWVRERLERKAREQAEQELHRALLDRLAELNPVPVPPSLVQATRAKLVERVRSTVDESIRERLGGSFDALVQQASALEAERFARVHLLLDAVARLEGLEVTDADVEARLEQIARERGQPVARIRAETRTREVRDRIADEIRHDRVLALLRSRARIVPPRPPSNGAAGAPGDVDATRRGEASGPGAAARTEAASTDADAVRGP